MVASSLTLRAFLDLYRQARPDLRPGSLQQITLSIGLLDLWAGREVFCHELCRELLLDFRAWRLEDRALPVCPKHCKAMRRVKGTQHRCPEQGCDRRATHVAQARHATANMNTRTLVALWYEAFDRGFNQQPKQRIRPLKEELDNLPCWNQDDLAAILKSCRQEASRSWLPCPMDAFWFALILVIYDTGSRISAIMDATPADLDWSRGVLTLRAKTTKGRKCDVKALDAQTLEALKAVCDASRAFIFPWPYGRKNRDWRTLRTRYKAILRRAGLPADKIHLFHKIRRTTATELVIASGLAAAREHLGHSAESVTKRYIDRRRLDETQRNARLLPRPSL